MAEFVLSFVHLSIVKIIKWSSSDSLFSISTSVYDYKQHIIFSISIPPYFCTVILNILKRSLLLFVRQVLGCVVKSALKKFNSESTTVRYALAYLKFF